MDFQSYTPTYFAMTQLIRISNEVFDSTFTDLSLSAVVLVALPKQLSTDLRRREAAFDPDIVTNHSAAAAVIISFSEHFA